MRLQLDIFHCPKHGSSNTEYEDAFWPPASGTPTGDALRLAIADGATESSYSGLWARQLVRAFGRKQLDLYPFLTAQQEPGEETAEQAVSDETRESAKEDTPRNFEDTGLPKLQRHWQRMVSRKPMAWYTEEKVRSGAFAAFAGLHLAGDPVEIVDPTDPIHATSGAWEAIACGDCCVIQIRKSELLCSFPIFSSEEFNTRPALIGTDTAQNAELGQHLSATDGRWKAGDRFFLMSDALACWFLRQSEELAEPWGVLGELDGGNPAEFETFVARLRQESGLKNDDVTLLRAAL